MELSIMETLSKQLKEIQEEGSRRIGYSYAIFKDDAFDMPYAMSEIMPELARRGYFDNARNDIYAPDMILDEYLSDLEVEDFELLAPYFFNYKGE